MARGSGVNKLNGVWRVENNPGVIKLQTRTKEIHSISFDLRSSS
jgi:hypothetical protein